MIKQIQLLFALLKDERVHPLIKLFPFLSLLYLVFPDLVPGPFDDAVVIALFLQFFLALIPDDIIEEHKQSRDKIIEGEFWEE
ncbi:MAG: hypothetical protein R6U57_00305 [Anaerolineales bacterium]